MVIVAGRVLTGLRMACESFRMTTEFVRFRILDKACWYPNISSLVVAQLAHGTPVHVCTRPQQPAVLRASRHVNGQGSRAYRSSCSRVFDFP